MPARTPPKPAAHDAGPASAAAPPPEADAAAPEAAAPIVAVALNVPLRRVFDYRLPEELSASVVPGSRVIVPFGSRLRSGIVVTRKAASDVPEARLRTVRRDTGAGPLLPEELLGFTRWVADYYCYGWGEVLEAALPSGLSVRFRAEYRVATPPLPERALAGLSDAGRAFVLARQQADEAAWDDAAWARHTEPADRAWLARHSRPGGLLAVHYAFAGTRTERRRERWVYPVEALPPAVSKRPAKRRTRAEQVLRVLADEGPVPVARLKAVVSDPAGVVRKLAGEGRVRIEERVADPAAPAPDVPPEPFLPLNPEQDAAFGRIRAALDERAYRGFLLEGVTGSGKTEVYLHAVRHTLAQGRSALLLVPEIALTAAIVNRFRSRFGSEVAVLHSGMGERERFEAWTRVREGHARIVIGPRSAVFAPLPDLGLVVVDEEHDTSYKQDEAPRYNGRDAAMVRALRNGAVAVLGTATPSLEAVRNVALGKLERLVLTRRVADRPLPEVEVLDLRRTPRQAGSTFFSRKLVDALRRTLLAGEQAILFLNRRGYAAMARCEACEEPVLCAHCSITLTYHQREGRLRCHRCDYHQPLPRTCPACGADALAVLGLGTERIEQEIGTMFPRARVLRMDSDTLRRRGELERMMAGIRERRYDVVIGTQVLSKGHDFPHITLVGAVLADVSLNLPDFRAPERTFQLLTQMAGRAGRGEKPGRVLIQTYNPEHYSLVHVRGHDTAAFTAHEAAIREAAGSPPYAAQALVWVSSPDEERAARLADDLADRLRAEAGPGLAVLGAAEAPIRRISGRYRYMILLKAPTVHPIHRVVHRVLDDPALRGGSHERVHVDVDPYNLL